MLLPSKFFDVDELECKFHEVSRDLHAYDEDFIVDVVFRYLRREGYPFFSYNEIEKRKIIDTLIDVDYSKYLVNGAILRSLMGIGLAWSYFPHHIEVSSVRSRSLHDRFEDDDSLRNILRKIIVAGKKYSGGVLRISKIRTLLKFYGDGEPVQSISNFRPTAAGVIYEKYAGDGVVWDMSCGWGGRLLGALTTSRVKQYIGTDPSIKTYESLLRMKEDFSYLGKLVDIHCLGSENYVPPNESLDLCFTSPPYFNIEHYCDEETQSYKKFPIYEDWLNGFLLQTMKNCWGGLKKDGYMVLNISDSIDKKLKVEQFTIEAAKSLGFLLEDILHLELSSIGKSIVKTEPIFVFRKV